MRSTVPDQRAGKPGMMKEAGKRRRRQSSGGGWGPPRFPRCGSVRAAVSARAPGSPRRARAAGGGARETVGPGVGGPGRGAARRRRRVSPAEESRSWTRQRRPRRGASGRADALLPSRLPADRGTAGTQRPDLSPGRVPKTSSQAITFS